MTVFGVSQVHEVKKAAGKKIRSASGSSFASLVEGHGDEVRSISGTTMVGSVDAILAAQQVGSALEERRRSLAHGEDVLRELDGLRLGLVEGAPEPERLRGLARMLDDDRMRPDDPGLKSILDEIALRVRVELEKLLRREG
ncbi:MAG: hypothetical protein A2018_06120 [Alphaproteobacteria bacterium GWF2_58_20]|nr:MAG: hypothetical protein A2018_06120 [Alphaproteobacteria bacterium GWF2_58_20]